MLTRLKNELLPIGVGCVLFGAPQKGKRKYFCDVLFCGLFARQKLSMLVVRSVNYVIPSAYDCEYSPNTPSSSSSTVCAVHVVYVHYIVTFIKPPMLLGS